METKQRNVKDFSPSIMDTWLFVCPFCRKRQETEDMGLPAKCQKCGAIIKVVAVKVVNGK